MKEVKCVIKNRGKKRNPRAGSKLRPVQKSETLKETNIRGRGRERKGEKLIHMF